MRTDDDKPRNWFDAGGDAYARFRPEYPPALAAWLAQIAPSQALAVDVGCGNGQLTRQLADHFDEVVGLDPSADQIAHAVPHARVRYRRASAEALPLLDRSAALITAAQAAHWFDLSAFYAEVRRVAAPGAVVALVSYGVLTLDEPRLQARFDQFYRDELGPYWLPERKLVDAGYVGMDFPFDEQAAPTFAIERLWGLDDFLGYLSTWSAVRRIGEAGHADGLTAFAREIGGLWGEAEMKRPITWPISMRIGTT